MAVWVGVTPGLTQESGERGCALHWRLVQVAVWVGVTHRHTQESVVRGKWVCTSLEACPSGSMGRCDTETYTRVSGQGKVGVHFIGGLSKWQYG